MKSVSQCCSGHISCTLAVYEEGRGVKCHGLGEWSTRSSEEIAQFAFTTGLLDRSLSGCRRRGDAIFSSNPCQPEMCTGGQKNGALPRPVRCRLLTEPRRAEKTAVTWWWLWESRSERVTNGRDACEWVAWRNWPIDKNTAFREDQQFPRQGEWEAERKKKSEGTEIKACPGVMQQKL